MSDIVKLSTEDLDWLEPGAIFANVARKWLVMGAKLVVLTKADAGAEAMAIRAFAAVPGVTVAVADTVGAGDTFMAAILARLDNRRLLTKRAVARLDEDALTDLLAFATRAAAITVSRPGADPPWQSELA
jgi:fructokinase